MLTIIIGILITIAVCILLLLIADISSDNSAIGFIVLLSMAGVVASICLGIFYPFSGYTDWKMVEETDLVSLNNSTASGGTGLIYLSLSADNAYTYRYEIDSEFGTDSSKEYETDTIIENVEEIEDPNCTKPVLRKYKRTGKKSLWTFGYCSETKNVFYVPEGSISKEINLK